MKQKTIRVISESGKKSHENSCTATTKRLNQPLGFPG